MFTSKLISVFNVESSIKGPPVRNSREDEAQILVEGLEVELNNASELKREFSCSIHQIRIPAAVPLPTDPKATTSITIDSSISLSQVHKPL
ncbi:MAG: hypothetical protein XD72_0750 [Methanothrix harundinacea]|uniref:Uncharacterized protein n=1 Tax=Methanothrix harundinacea TaxID=301375 RepID=A0A117MCF8_9EURY|nr:MAG: hypothetical protein XD72_0750 [Methanothrix harundinacea]KUK96399.1 MAG: hypothetical protein XE07_1157 [Methanothrix harundinacea]